MLDLDERIPLRSVSPEDSVIIEYDGFRYVLSFREVEEYVDGLPYDPDGEFAGLLGELRSATLQRDRRHRGRTDVVPYLLADLMQQGRMVVRDPASGSALPWIRIVQEVAVTARGATRGRVIHGPAGEILLRVVDSVVRS